MLSPGRRIPELDAKPPGGSNASKMAPERPKRLISGSSPMGGGRGTNSALWPAFGYDRATAHTPRARALNPTDLARTPRSVVRPWFRKPCGYSDRSAWTGSAVAARIAW